LRRLLRSTLGARCDDPSESARWLALSTFFECAPSDPAGKYHASFDLGVFYARYSCSSNCTQSPGNFDLVVTPEPSTALLVDAGLALLAAGASHSAGC
jgi:hypothetical protein